MDVAERTLGELVDLLISTDMHCWFAQEVVCNSTDKDEVYEAAKRAQQMNARRNALIRAIDERTNDPYASPSGKTYA